MALIPTHIAALPDLHSAVPKAREKDTMDLISRARDFARAKHAGQFRKGAAREPYEAHLAEVADLVASFGGSPEVIAAAWLHDTVEDCEVAAADIVERFGAKVAGMVAEVTDDKTLDAAERKRMQVVNAKGKSPGAALVKICDKTSNIRAVSVSPALEWSVARQSAYLEWAAEVVAALPAGADPARARFAAELLAARQAVAGR